MRMPAILSDEARRLLKAPVQDRARWIQTDQWVHTPTTQVAYQWMEYLLRSERRLRPMCLQIIADPGMGKSALLSSFSALHPVAPTEDPLRLSRRVLLADCFEHYGVGGLRGAIMQGAWPNARIEEVSGADLDATLRAQGTYLILLDEAGELLKCGPSLHRNLLGELRRITHQLGINLAAATVSGLDHVFRQDPQLESRFKRRIKITPWSESQDFRNFIFGIEHYLPFPERSFLDSEAIVRWLILHGRGNTEDIIEFVQHAALIALLRDANFVAIEDFEAARLSATPPMVPFP